MVHALKSPTNLASNASGCNTKPSLVLSSADTYSTIVIYHLKLINNCDGHYDFKVEVSDFPTSPQKFDGWTWMVKGGSWNMPYVMQQTQGTNDVTLTIARPVGKDGLPVQLQKGVYQPFEVKASLEDNPSLSSTLNLDYTVQ